METFSWFPLLSFTPKTFVGSLNPFLCMYSPGGKVIDSIVFTFLPHLVWRFRDINSQAKSFQLAFCVQSVKIAPEVDLDICLIIW